MGLPSSHNGRSSSEKVEENFSALLTGIFRASNLDSPAIRGPGTITSC